MWQTYVKYFYNAIKWMITMWKIKKGRKKTMCNTSKMWKLIFEKQQCDRVKYFQRATMWEKLMCITTKNMYSLMWKNVTNKNVTDNDKRRKMNDNNVKNKYVHERQEIMWKMWQKTMWNTTKKCDKIRVTVNINKLKTKMC